MQTAITEDRQTQLLRDVQNIPSLPTCVTKLLEATQDKRMSAADVAAILEKDVGLAAKVLRLANSPIYGLRSQVSSIANAVAVLGFNTVREIAFAASFVRMFDSSQMSSPMAFWRHSICCALSSRVLARRLHKECADDIFTAALFHDIGKSVIQRSIPHSYECVAALCARDGVSFREAETQVLGTDHTYIGEGVCRQWQLPPSIAVCARYHHSPQELTGASLPVVQAVAIVHLGNWLAHQIAGDGWQEGTEYGWLDGLDHTASLVNRAAAEVETQLHEMELALGLRSPSVAA